MHIVIISIYIKGILVKGLRIYSTSSSIQEKVDKPVILEEHRRRRNIIRRIRWERGSIDDQEIIFEKN